MKKNLFIVAAVALVAFVSCNKEEINNNVDVQPQQPSVTVEFTAGFSATKTSLVEGKTVWVETDRISINGQEFKVKELINDGAKAIFENVAELPGNFSAPYTAVYPYGSNGIPATQTAYADNFDPTAVIETATSETTSLHFQNEASLLKFQVPAACETVTISSDDALAGSDAKTVTVNGSFATGKTYYAAVLPGTKNNFVVRIDGYLSRNDASVDIPRSTIANMKTLPAPVKSDWGIVGTMTSWTANKDIAMYQDGDYSVAKNVTIASNDEFKFRKGGDWNKGGEIAGGITAPNTKRDGGWVNITVSEAGIYDVYTNGNQYYIMTPGKLPSEAAAPGDIEITVTFAEDANHDYIHIWSDGGNIANSMQCTSKANGVYTWKVKVPAGDQQKRDYQFILKKGSGWGNYQTSDSDKLCLRNPMPLQIVNNKVTHK